MHSAILDGLTRQTAIHAIELYQQHLSPRKGFECPHRVLYGDESCSDYVKLLFHQQNLASALRQSVQRFQSCGLAAKTLHLQTHGGCIVIPCCIPL